MTSSPSPLCTGTTTKILTILVIQVASLSSASYYFDRDNCLACVEPIQRDGEFNCTYCKGNKYFGNPGICTCADISAGLYGNCSDHIFGADELTSKWDCRFGKSNGSVLIVVLPVAAVGVLLLGIHVCYKCRQRNDDKSNSSTAPVIVCGTAVFATAVTSGGSDIPTATCIGFSVPTAALGTEHLTDIGFGGNNGFNDGNTGFGGSGVFGDTGASSR
eukprot:826420_1